MDKRWFETFSDRAYWEALVQTYIQTGTAPSKLPFSKVEALWDYFKFCILTDNRYLFDHPLMDVVKRKIGEHEMIMPQNTTLFRVRIDVERKLRDQAENLKSVRTYTTIKEDERFAGNGKIDDVLDRLTSEEGFDTYQEQYKNGFEGFPSAECLVPPAYKVPNGRCNMAYSPHLYASGDIHTAVVETRPYIFDTVSVASLGIKKDLRIVDFCFDWTDRNLLHDGFFMAMSSDFSAVNKGNENDYFATQYLTMMVKGMGYDGLRFKSSLALNGINYVIFDASNCRPISSKLYTIVQAHYDMLPVSEEINLKDASGDDVDDPPLVR